MRSKFYASVILWVITAAIAWLLFMTTTGCATAEPLLPDCRELLAASYATQMARGDLALKIEQIDVGGVRLSYLNKCSGIYTEYYLILDSRNAGNPDELPVYGSCMINDSVATMFIKKWLTVPEKTNDPSGYKDGMIWHYGTNSRWLYKVHSGSDKVCYRLQDSTSA